MAKFFYILAAVIGILIVVGFFNHWNGIVMSGIAVVLAIFLATAVILGFRSR